MALRIYSIDTDNPRDVTQQDVDEMQAAVQAYGRLRTAMAETHERLQADLAEIRSKYARQAAVANPGPVLTEPEEREPAGL